MKRLIIFFAGTFLFFSFVTSSVAEIDWNISSDFKTDSTPLDLASSLDGKLIFTLSKGKVHIHSNDGKLKGTIEVNPDMDNISVSGLSLAGIEAKIYLSSTKSRTVQEISYSFVVQINTKNSPFLGKEDAQVEVVVFSEFQCPHCSRLGPLFEETLANNPETVKIVYKNFPIRGHNNAKPAALAALAAHEQGKFWEYHDELYANMRQLGPKKYQEIAETLKLDLEKFKKDQTSPEVKKQLERDLQDAKQAGVRGTPTIFINGRKLKDRNIVSVQKLIDAELDRLGKEKNVD
ncbi:MAG: thioredoxin domain-containing protein [Desulfobulbaceae bacterium]|nr:thioredoxin domain-containing protein [Desulfobulbaceae bacterium]